MFASRLQEPFLQEIADAFRDARDQLIRGLKDAPAAARGPLIDDAMRDLFINMFTILDGATALANQGTLTIVDDEGQSFDAFLHELCLAYWHETA